MVSLQLSELYYEQFTSKYESDLMAKIYFAKRKLVWEVLDSGGLKNKMEIRWSDISAIKATYPEDGLGTLDVAVIFYKRQYLVFDFFFLKINFTF